AEIGASRNSAAITSMRAGNAPAIRLVDGAESALPRSAVTAAPPSGLPRLEIGRARVSAEVFAGLLPDFTVAPSRRSGDAAIVAWAGSSGLPRRRARAARLGVPFMVLSEGLLRAAPRAGAREPRLSALGLSVLALEVSGPPSLADK